MGVLLNKDEELSSISETIVAHIDMTQRRTMNMPQTLLRKVEAVSVVVLEVRCGLRIQNQKYTQQ